MAPTPRAGGASWRLIKALKATGKQVVTILFNGRPLVLDEVLQYSDALLEAWHPGTMAGRATALLLSGQENPSGKLTQIFPRHAGQIPVAYNERRTFAKILPSDLPEGPQFPFGFGLSYTQFVYSDLTVSRETLGLSDNLEVKVRGKNMGKRAGRGRMCLGQAVPLRGSEPMLQSRYLRLHDPQQHESARYRARHIRHHGRSQFRAGGE